MVDRPASLPAPERAGRGQAKRSAGAGEVGRYGDLGRLWDQRGARWAEAVRVRQLDRKLSRTADRVNETRDDLQQVKLYPPYPIDESRRAAAIRQFNGIAEEIRRLEAVQEAVPGLPTLSATASTAEAEGAVAALGRVGVAIAGQRAALTAATSSRGELELAESTSLEVARGLGGEELALSRRSDELLRQIA
ncbi:MAG: hypothetical protein ACKVZ0_21620 [Gemmatimonadales bacterium]